MLDIPFRAELQVLHNSGKGLQSFNFCLSGLSQMHNCGLAPLLVFQMRCLLR